MNDNQRSRDPLTAADYARIEFYVLVYALAGTPGGNAILSLLKEPKEGALALECMPTCLLSLAFFAAARAELSLVDLLWEVQRSFVNSTDPEQKQVWLAFQSILERKAETHTC